MSFLPPLCCLDFSFVYSILQDTLVPEVVQDKPKASQADIWCWQEEFKLVVTTLALAIAKNIQSSTRTALDKEMEEYEIYHKYEAARVTGE